MKKSIYTLSIALFSSLISLSQAGYIESTAIESDDEMYQGYQWSLSIPQDIVEDELDDYFSDKYDKKIKGGGFLSSKDDQTVEAVSITGYDYPINLHFRMYTMGEQDKTTELLWWASDTEGKDITEPAVKDEMEAFVKGFAPAYFAEQKQEVLDEISDLDKDISKLDGNIEKKDGQAEKMQQKVDKLQLKIDKLKNEMTEERSEKSQLIEEMSKLKREKNALTTRLEKIKRHL